MRLQTLIAIYDALLAQEGVSSELLECLEDQIQQEKAAEGDGGDWELALECRRHSRFVWKQHSARSAVKRFTHSSSFSHARMPPLSIRNMQLGQDSVSSQSKRYTRHIDRQVCTHTSTHRPTLALVSMNCQHD